MSNQSNAFLETVGIIQCSQKFISPTCFQQVTYFVINILIFFYLAFELSKKFKKEGILRIPKTKTIILIILQLALIFQLVYQIESTLHWTFYLYIFMDYTYFVWILYYFGKKILKLSDRIQKLKFYKFMVAFIILLFFTNFVYSILLEQHKKRALCNQDQYTYARFVGLIIEILLSLVGFRLNRVLIKKLQATKTMTLSERNKKKLEKTYQDIRILIILISIFMIGQISLLVTALFFKFKPSNNCNFFVDNQIANITLQMIVKILGNFLPKIYTVYVFGTRQYLVRNNNKSKQEKQMNELFRSSLLIKRLSLITDSNRQ